MTAPLTFHQPHPGGRILLRMGQHDVGAVFPQSRDPERWSWSFWLGGQGSICPGPGGRAKSEQAAKNALLAEARDWLIKAGVGP